MVSANWIDAYYIFNEHLTHTPADNELPVFIAKCVEGFSTYAFFLDEIDMTSSSLYDEAVFSIPVAAGRVIARFGNLSVFHDAAWGRDFDVLVLDAGTDGGKYTVVAPGVKAMPVRVDGKDKTAVLMRALDRDDSALRWEAAWDAPSAEAAGEIALAQQFILDITYENFLLAAEIGGPQDNEASFFELRSAEKELSKFGFVREIFTLQMLQKLAEPLLMLSLAIFAFVLGYRYRVRIRRARYSFFPMLFILPVVYHALINLIRRIATDLNAVFVVKFPFQLAVAALCVFAAILFFLSIFCLAAQTADEG
jgi:hypothetical protein